VRVADRSNETGSNSSLKADSLTLCGQTQPKVRT
jgi:hypothetical protein